MTDDRGKRFVAAVSSDAVAKRLRDSPGQDALIQFNHDCARAYFDGDMEAAAFWLVVYVRWKGIEPSARMRELLVGLLSRPSVEELH